MLSCQAFYELLAGHGVDFYAGVPDSLLKDFCAYVTDHADAGSHVITANEGGAVALAAGRYLATGAPGVVYLQNSGLGNTVNPLTSLADQAVYGLPMLLVVGWRGAPGVKDEPQHVKMGGVTAAILDAIEIPWAELPTDLDAAQPVVARAFEHMARTGHPFALVVRKGTFAPYALQTSRPSPCTMTREQAIGAVASHIPSDIFVVSTTGKPSRELFELRVARGESHDRDFLTVGSMGHASQIALGLALSRPDEPVVCLDGDGAAIMHLGGLTTIGTEAGANYRHIVLNNAAHDSVGGQPTCGFDVDLCAVATASGYSFAASASTEAEVASLWEAFWTADGPSLIEVRVKTGARKDLGRPTRTPQELKRAFMGALGVTA